MKIFKTKAKLIKNIVVAPKHYKILLASSTIAKSARPGQFLAIKISNSYEPLLRRPFSIHRVKDGKVELLYEVVGIGTEILSQRKTGEYLDVIGPLGNGFNYQLPITNYQLPILVAGGMGVAPLIFLAERLAKSKEQRAKNRVLVLIGAETKNYILCAKEFRELGCKVKIATDDGSKGFKGKVTELLKQILLKNSRTQELKNSIYACGPRSMLQEIAFISQHNNIPAEVSWEEHMACGIGACLGCAVKTKDGYKRVCKEGPVFNADAII